MAGGGGGEAKFYGPKIHPNKKKYNLLSVKKVLQRRIFVRPKK